MRVEETGVGREILVAVRESRRSECSDLTGDPSGGREDGAPSDGAVHGAVDREAPRHVVELHRTHLLPVPIHPEVPGSPMSNRSIGLSPDLHAYLVRCSVREPDVLRRLRERTAKMEEADMQIAPEQGAFLSMLVRMTEAHQVLEIGVFTGYSSTALALALPDEGRLTACDVSEVYTALARQGWQEAGVEDKVELYVAPASDTLDALIGEGRTGTYDLAFIDADKVSYSTYYEHTLRLLRPGGVVVLDNMLRSGRVIDPAEDDEGTRAIMALNEAIFRDDRVDVCMIPIADGVTLARKR